MGRMHMAVGVAFVLVFLATGLYMRSSFPDAFHGDATMRMLFRSAHIYLLLSALANLAIAGYVRRMSRWRVGVQWLGSAALLAAPFVFTAAFFVEPAPERLDRPISLAGVVCVALGAICHAVASARVPPAASDMPRSPQE